ncbi:integrase family protein [Bdellovibrio bacteriovorus W]|nr:integrase family protein [Bdellovibrio bacteriovorus W]
MPLSSQVFEILQQLKSITTGAFIFGSLKLQTYSDASLRKALSLIGYYGAHQDISGIENFVDLHSPHGVRASFRTIADEVLEWRVDILEQQLAHIVRDTNGRAHNRTTHLPKKTQMMQLWSYFIVYILDVVY